MHLKPRYRILYSHPWQQLSAPTPVTADESPISNSTVLITYRRPWYVRDVKQPTESGGTIASIDAITYYVYLMVTGPELKCVERYADELKSAISFQIEHHLPPDKVALVCRNNICSYIVDAGQPPSRTGLPDVSGTIH